MAVSPPTKPRPEEADAGAPARRRFGSTTEETALFDFQHAAICYYEAFSRHIARQLVAVTGDASLSAPDCMILHAVRMGARPKSIPDIQHFLNRSDVANVQYSVKKLVKSGLVQKAAGHSARGTGYELTERGERVSALYIENRGKLMADFMRSRADFRHDVETATRLLMTLTGIFDHLSRTDRA